MRIDGDAALAAAVGEIGERAFPAHPDRERRDLADVDVGGETRAALGGTEGQVMLDPVAGKDLGPSAVHVYRAGDDDRPLRKQETVALLLGNGEMVGDDMELFARHLEHRAGIEVFHAAAPSSSKSGAAFGALAAPATGQLGFQHKDRNRAELEERAA